MKIFLLALLMIACCSFSAQAQMQLLKITKADGTVKVMRLDAVKNITFSEAETSNYQLKVMAKAEQKPFCFLIFKA